MAKRYCPRLGPWVLISLLGVCSYSALTLADSQLTATVSGEGSHPASVEDAEQPMWETTSAASDPHHKAEAQGALSLSSSRSGTDDPSEHGEDSTQGAQQPPKPSDRTKGKAFRHLDRDGDGMLSREELPERMDRLRKHFDAADQNKDGLLSHDEIRRLRAHTESRSSPRGRGDQRNIMKRLDRDGDGAISRSEVPARATRLNSAFDRLDRNGDGELTADELPGDR